VVCGVCLFLRLARWFGVCLFVFVLFSSSGFSRSSHQPSSADPYYKISVMKNKAKTTIYQSETIRNSTHPTFDEVCHLSFSRACAIIAMRFLLRLALTRALAHTPRICSLPHAYTCASSSSLDLFPRADYN
jgi:hypothetical protein